MTINISNFSNTEGKIEKALKVLPNHMQIPNKAEFAKAACEFYLQELKRKKIIP
tara:strand:- start:251 stop:412 length:162 start_codon:yes stop_codon:yes gene_type:complete